MFENAKWIAATTQNNIDELAPAPLFRKEFMVNKVVKRANIYCCALGLGYYYLNGKKITDEVLITPFTKYDKTVLYSSFDITNYVKEGNNVVGVVVGNGCYCVHGYRWDKYKPSWSSYPKLIAQIDIEYEDSTVQQIFTDRDWMTSDSPVIYNQTKIGEIYDARLEQNGWATTDFDSSKWRKAYISRPPGGMAKKNILPPIRVTKEFSVKHIGGNIYDIGQNISGWVKLKVRGNAGSSITVQYAECLDKNGKPDYDKLNTIIGSQTHTDKYILKGTGIEEWSPGFAYHGFRYFEISGDAELIEAVGQFVHTDMNVKGDFWCSDEMLNKIHRMTIMASLSNCMGLITDCPQREQNGWTGDALMSVDQMLINFDITNVYKKWLRDMLDEQRPTGQIPCVVPTGGWGFEWGTGPCFDSFMIIAPLKIYEYTGDKSCIEMMWNGMERLMNFMNSMADDYIVNYGLADWRTPPGEEVCPAEITDTAYYYTDAVTMARSAKIIGENPEKYLLLAQKIKEAFRSRFVKDGYVINKTQTVTVCAVYHGLLSREEEKKNIERMVNNIKNEGYHFKTGIYGTKFMFDVLANNGYNECLYKMVTNPEMPSYAYWVNNGMTTLCETWDLQESLNHHMFSEIDNWFYKHLGGVHFNDGKVTIIPEPYIVDTVKIKIGDIYIERNKNHIHIESPKSVRLKTDITDIEISGIYDTVLSF